MTKKKDSKPGDTTASERRRSAISGIEQRVLKRLRLAELGPRPSIVVGFSGGADSLCLAAILTGLGRRTLLEPLLVHVDHGLRPNSKLDAAAATELAGALGAPIQVHTIEGDLQEKHPGAGIEEAARRERYLLLAQAAAEYGAQTIAVAHHQDDQAETVLLHLFRGSGLKGAAGMAELTSMVIPWWSSESSFSRKFTVWRPLLTEPKAEIDAFVAELRLTPIVDESNTDLTFRRNVIRHSILPEIGRFFPAATAAISSFARIATDENELLETFAHEWLKRAGLACGRLTRSQLMLAPLPIQRRIVVIWLGQWVSSDAISLDRVDAVLEVATMHRRGKLIEVGENVGVELIGDELIARRTNTE